jgi:proline racemase
LRKSTPDRLVRTIELVDARCQGAIGKMIVGGALEIPGGALDEKIHAAASMEICAAS